MFPAVLESFGEELLAKGEAQCIWPPHRGNLFCKKGK
jgi:hypothetical protein